MYTGVYACAFVCVYAYMREEFFCIILSHAKFTQAKIWFIIFYYEGEGEVNDCTGGMISRCSVITAKRIYFGALDASRKAKKKTVKESISL